MNDIMKNTTIYKTLKASVEKERKYHNRNDCFIPVSIVILLIIIFCVNCIKPIYTYFVGTQESLGRFLAALGVIAISILIAIIVSCFIGIMVETIIYKIYYTLKFRYLIAENYDKLVNEYKNHINFVYLKFLNYQDDSVIHK